MKKTRYQITHCKRSIGVSRKGNLRSVRQSRLNSISIMNPCHDPRNVVADDTEDSEWVLAVTNELAKIFGSSVMRWEIRFREAGPPCGLDDAGGMAMDNLKRCIEPVPHSGCGW